MDGIKKIPISEITGWCQITGYWLERWELDAIRRLDEAFIEAMSKRDTGGDDHGGHG